MNMMTCHTKKKHELMVNLYCCAVKKKVIVETTDHKAGVQAIEASATDVEGSKPQPRAY
jgi:hypothetical protein